MARSVRAILNEGNPNKLGDAAHALPMGEGLALIPRSFRGAPVANVLVLPEAAKAAAVLSAFGAGTSGGYKSPDITGAAPAAGEAAPNAAGDIAFNGADAITDAEVQYLAYEGQIVEDLIAVDAGGTEQGTLLGNRAASVILEVEALAGTAAGPKTVALRGSTPGAGASAIAEDPTLIEFAAADAITQARVRYVAQPGVGDSPDAVGTVLDADVQQF